MADTLHCNVITPEKSVIECDATSVVLPAHDGEIGFLKNRAPLLCKLGMGELRVATLQGDRHYFLDGGFAQMVNNELTILTERADEAASIDPAKAEAELKEAQAMPALDLASREVKDHALARAKLRKRIAAERR